MRPKTYLITLLLFISYSIHAQQKMIEFEVVKEPNTLLIYGSNNSEEPLEITLTLKDVKMLKGYTKPVTKVVSAKGKELFIKLTYTYDVYTYKMAYSYKKVETEVQKSIRTANKVDYYLKDLSKIDEGIVVFDDEGCGRCTLVTNYLIGNKIDFKIINIANNEANQKFMWKMVKDKGASLKVKAPVIIVNGKLSHSHPDLEKFLKSLH